MDSGVPIGSTIFALLFVAVIVGFFGWIVVNAWRAGGTPPTPETATPAEEREHLSAPTPTTTSRPPADPPVKRVEIDLDAFEAVDLRALPSTRMRVRGHGNWIGWEAAVHYASPEFTLIREPGNPHDPSAVSVHHPSGRRIGYISAKRAAGMAPALDALGPAAFVVGGSFDGSRLWVDLPLLPDLRRYAKSVPASD